MVQFETGRGPEAARLVLDDGRPKLDLQLSLLLPWAHVERPKFEGLNLATSEAATKFMRPAPNCSSSESPPLRVGHLR